MVGRARVRKSMGVVLQCWKVEYSSFGELVVFRDFFKEFNHC
jgi:hypothetical protein